MLTEIERPVKPAIAVPDDDDAPEAETDVLYDEDEAVDQRALEDATIERFARVRLLSGPGTDANERSHR